MNHAQTKINYVDCSIEELRRLARHGNTAATRGHAIDELARRAEVGGDLLTASRALLERLDSITTEDFSKGGEKQEREALRGVIKRLP